ncbi:MAG: hypothetical protein GX800_12595 [Clostridiaceae bacterium]|nr:hypothetical protein [Clostridiaceae bacterium]
MRNIYLRIWLPWTKSNCVKEIAKEREGLDGLIILDITRDEIIDVLNSAKFKNYRFDVALEWISKTLEMVRRLV